MDWVDIMDHGTMFWKKVPSPPRPDENPVDMMKMYILVNRSKLTIVQSGVQASHASSEYVYFNHSLPSTKEWAENHKTMILLEATEEDIVKMADYFTRHGKKAYIFKEPDLDNLTTACAFEPIQSSDGKVLFGKFKLLR